MGIVVVRVLIEDSVGTRRFNGTAFFINSNTLITAKHVLANAIEKDYKIYLSEIPGGGKLFVPSTDIELCKRDVAVIYVKKEFDSIKGLGFTDKLKVGLDVKLIGYHNEDGAINFYNQNISGYTNSEHTYEIQDARTNGLSGSPVILDDEVCGITQAISSKKGVTYIIPISECCSKLVQDKLNDNNKVRDEALDIREVSQILDNSNFRIILSRRYSNSRKYEKTVDEVFSKKDFKVKTFPIYEYDFNLLKELSILFDFSDEKSLELKLDKKIKNSNDKYLLIIKNFEDIENKIKDRFANLLRSLIEDNENFYLIIFGGKKLAQLAYENGNTSLFSNATMVFREEDSDVIETIKRVTGDHPKLNELCKNMKQGQDIDYYKEQLRVSATSPIIFNGYEDEGKLCRFFERKDFGLYNIWNQDELIRELFWENLLKEEKGRLIWRSEFIRQLGKELKCET